MSNSFHDYQEEIKSIQKQIPEIKRNLRLIEQRESEYVEQHKIPLDLCKDKDKQEAKLVALRQRLAQLLDTVADLSDRSKILSLEPYLLNRIEQEVALLETIEKLKNPDRLIVCLVHGDNLQSQDTLPMRLQASFFPNVLKRDTIFLYHISFPDSFQNAQNFHAQLQYILARAIPNYGLTNSNEEINNRFIAINQPILIYASMLTSNWLESSSEVITNFLDFWNNWPPLSPSQRLFVFLFIKYVPQQTRKKQRFFTKIMGRYREGKIAKLNKDIQDLVDRFAHSNFSRFSNFHGTALPILKGITEQQAMDWVDAVNRKHFSGNLAFIVDTKLEIKAIFNQYQSTDLPKRIPMDDLALRLKGILYEYTARRELA